MQRIAIQSMIIKSASYDEQTQTLEVEFVNGNVGTYAEVPPEVWEAFWKAPSKGRFLTSQLKGQYQYRKH